MARKSKSPPSPETAPAGRVLYVAGEDGNFYAIPEAEMKRSYAVAEGDPIRELLEGYLAFGVVHSNSARPAGGGRGVAFSTLSQAPAISTSQLPVDFVDLGRAAGSPPAEAAPADEPPHEKKKKKKRERKD